MNPHKIPILALYVVCTLGFSCAVAAGSDLPPPKIIIRSFDELPCRTNALSTVRCDLANGHTWFLERDDGRARVRVVETSMEEVVYLQPWSSGFSNILPPVTLFENLSGNAWGITYLQEGAGLTPLGLRFEATGTCSFYAAAMSGPSFIEAMSTPCADQNFNDNPVISQEIGDKIIHVYETEISDWTCGISREIICPGLLEYSLKIATLAGKSFAVPQSKFGKEFDAKAAMVKFNEALAARGQNRSVQFAGTVYWMVEKPYMTGDVGVDAIIILFTSLGENDRTVATKLYLGFVWNLGSFVYADIFDDHDTALRKISAMR